ncbi:hypothetical protein RhiirA4_330320, partial [Rhizophagus irregularis]
SLKNQGKDLFSQPGRTHNRSKSPKDGSKDWAYWVLVRRFAGMREFFTTYNDD